MDTTTPKRAPGRPPKPPEEKRRNVLSLRFTDAELDRLETLAADAGEKVATFAWRRLTSERD